MMVDIQDTSLNYFIYMCFVQASSVSTTTCIDHHVFMVLFLSEMNYFPTLVGLFFQWQKQTNKLAEQFIATIKNLSANVLLNVLSLLQIIKS